MKGTLTHSGKLDKIITSLARELPDLMGLFIFFGTSYIIYFTFIPTDSPFVQLFFLAMLIGITLIRTIVILSTLLFSPTALTLRVLPMECRQAGITHKLIIWSASYIIVALLFSIVAFRLGAPILTVHLLQLFFATLLLALTAVAAILKRNRVKNHILSVEAQDSPPPSWGKKQFASVWHILALIYLCTLWLLLINDITDPDQKNRAAFLLSFFVLPIWMVADRVIQWLVQYAMSTLKIHQQQYDEAEVSEEELHHREQGKKVYGNVRVVARTGLVLTLSVWIASLWNIKIPLFSDLTGVLFDALVILTLALFFWQFISSWIERKIEESLPEEEDQQQLDDEWGSAASRGRSYTLLPMIRRFIATILVVMVTMTVLSSMGVDIGPLLAGAGVVGLAIGFGAQKLVADMFSGFFYLLDDAFRVGEYMTAGGVSGTVENISLRNIMLRHHRGMLQIIPHSELGAITNYMRGGIVVKFNLDFPYDADIDKIRKIIKKVGQDMLADDELGKDFIRPVKSQGVREITDSVMTIRVKFTAQPGAHFVIRREAFKRITEALQAKEIAYAHKKVIVDIPPQVTGNADQVEHIAQAAGAAAHRRGDNKAANGEQKPETPKLPEIG